MLFCLISFYLIVPQDSSSIVKESEIYSLPPPVATQRTVKGEVQWSSLRLVPPPPMYRPFIAMEEERKKNKKSLKEKPSKHNLQCSELLSRFYYCRLVATPDFDQLNVDI